MKFILELEAKEVAHLSKKGILEAVIKELEESVHGVVVNEISATASPIKAMDGVKEEEVAKPKKKVSKKTETKEDDKSLDEVNRTVDTPKITTDQVREIMVAKVKGGKKAEAKEILNKYAESLSQVASEDLQALYDELKVL